MRNKNEFFHIYIANFSMLRMQRFFHALFGALMELLSKTSYKNLQNRAARIVTNSPFDSSATSLIQDLGWPTIEELIHRETSVMAYKCLNKLAPNFLSSCISKLSDRHTRELRNSAADLQIPFMTMSYRQKPFAFRGAKEWNNLDLRTKLAPSMHCFKSCSKDSKINCMG